MKKISIHSMVMGIGLGIIISSIVNIIWIQLENSSFNNEEITSPELFDSALHFNNNTNNIDKSLVSENHQNPYNKKSDLQIESKPNDKEDADNKTYKEVFIPKGFNSEDISTLLVEEGIIESSEEFNKLAADLIVTKKMQHGLKTIPENSTINEIIKILTKK